MTRPPAVLRGRRRPRGRGAADGRAARRVCSCSAPPPGWPPPASTCSGEARGGVYGARVLVLAGSGDNGGDALYAGARLARRGAAGRGAAAEPGQGARRRPRRRCARPAAGWSPAESGARPTWCSTASSASAAPADCAPTPPTVWQQVAAARRHGGGGRRAQRRRRRRRHASTATHVDADVTVTFGAYKVGLLAGPGPRARRAVHLVDIGLADHLPGDPALRRAHRPTTWPTLLGRRGARPGRPQVHPRRGRCGGRLRGVHRRRAAGRRRRLVRARRHGPLRRAATRSPTWCGPRRPEVVVGAGRVQAWVVGLRRRRRRRGGARAGARATACRWWSTPTRCSTCTGPLGVPALLTPHAGELAGMLGVERAEIEADPLRFAREAAETVRRGRPAQGRPHGGHRRRPHVRQHHRHPLAGHRRRRRRAGRAGGAAARRRLHDPLRVGGGRRRWLHGAAATRAGRAGRSSPARWPPRCRGVLREPARVSCPPRAEARGRPRRRTRQRRPAARRRAGRPAAGRGQGRRLRARAAAGRPGGAGGRGAVARRRGAGGGARAACRRRHRAGCCAGWRRRGSPYDEAVRRRCRRHRLVAPGSWPRSSARRAPTGVRARLQLKADTGLSRNGCPPADWPDLVEATAAARSATAPCSDRGVVALRLRRRARPPGQRRPAAGLRRGAGRGRPRRAGARGAAPGQLAGHADPPAAHYDLVRPGLAVYGLSPAPEVAERRRVSGCGPR